MALTLSGTNGIVGAGFTVDNSGVSVTAGVGTFANIVSPNISAGTIAGSTGTFSGDVNVGAGITLDASAGIVTAANEVSAGRISMLTVNTGGRLITSGAFLTIQAATGTIIEDLDGNNQIKGNDGGSVQLYHNGTEQCSTSANGLAFPSGKGIDFSATGDGSGTDSSELLDDYEEGSWTPTITGGAITANGAYYTKIGRVVHWYLYATITNTANNSTEFRIYGLPYTVGSDSTGLNNYYGGASSFNYTQSANNAGLTSLGVLTRTGNTYIYFHFVGTGDGNSPVNSYFHSHLLNQGFIIAGAYFV